MKKRICVFRILLCTALSANLLLGVAGAADCAPQTAYAKQFIEACEGQTWFIDEIERLLNQEQRTLDTVNGPEDFSEIRSLGLKDRNITGKIPSAIGELKELRYLFLSGNHLSGEIPASLYALPKLQNIDLSGNDYSGTVPSGFGTMSALTVLNLKGDRYQGTIPASILDNTKLEVLNLEGNRLTGGIPVEIANMTGLKYLNLSENNLGGTIPDLSPLSELLSLSLWDCGLAGTIPDSLYTMTTLQILDLSDNALEGEISPAIGNLTNLQYLALDSNQLRGLLPDAFTNTKMEEIHLEKNFLRGMVPNTLKERGDKGTEVYLEENYMTGSVLRGMPHNAGNFSDGASTEQYQLTAKRMTLQIGESGTVNLYALLLNQSLATGNTSKALLRPEEYTVEWDRSKVELTQDANGIYAKALTELPKSAPATVTLRIKDNTGSAYSTVKLSLTTEPVTDGGSGGGGSAVNPGSGGNSSAAGGTTVLHKSYINGYADGSFYPSRDVTRAQIAKMLVDALEREHGPVTVPIYTDVPAEHWAASWIEAAAREGFMQGYRDGSFAPNQAITRGEMAAVLTRIAAKEGLELNSEARTFSDVPEDAWYADTIQQAVRYGLINGYGDGTFRPNQPITRAETVVMINRLLGRSYTTAAELHTKESPFPDVGRSYWAYGDIMEAANTHHH